MSVVLQPTVDALSPVERRLWRASGRAVDRCVGEYLDAFTDCLPDQGAEAFRDGSLSVSVLSEAARSRVRGVRTWHGMRGSTPVWYHVVASPQERAAALVYSGSPEASVVHVHTGLEDAPGPPVDLFGGPTTDQGEWYPDPGVRIEYAPAGPSTWAPSSCSDPWGMPGSNFSKALRKVVSGCSGRFAPGSARRTRHTGAARRSMPWTAWSVTPATSPRLSSTQRPARTRTPTTWTVPATAPPPGRTVTVLPDRASPVTCFGRSGHCSPRPRTPRPPRRRPAPTSARRPR
ncbi:hypothetical protein ACR6C2_34780 [Streptomyces sp. INA 01156]